LARDHNADRPSLRWAIIDARALGGEGATMSAVGRMKHEFVLLALATLFFGAWVGSLVVFKHLLLEEYSIDAYGYSAAIVGVLILAKVVLVLERAPLGAWIATRPAWVEVVLRTVLYSVGVLVVLTIEHGVKGRAEHGGFVAALRAAVGEEHAPHVLLNVYCVGGAFLVYNAMSVVRRNLPEGSLRRIFLSRPAGA